MAGALSGTVDVPKVGKFPKAAVVLGVGGVLVLIVYQNKKNAAAAAASSPAAAATDPNAIDPATGLTYAQEAAGGAGGGYYGGGGASATGLQTSAAFPWDGTYNNPNDPYSMDSATGQTYGNEGYSGNVSSYSGGQGGPPFSTNAQWSQYVLNYFAGSGNLQGITDAIGLYLSGGTVTALQQGYINDATAIAGVPPVDGPGGYPPSIRVSGSTGGGAGGSGGSGGSGGGAESSVTNGRIDYNNPGGNVQVSWTPVGPATSWDVTRTGPGGTVTNHVTKPQATYENLARGHNFEIRIQPLPSGTIGGIDFKTK